MNKLPTFPLSRNRRETEKMIKCLNCERVFENDEAIPLLIEWEDGQAEPFVLGKEYRPGGEVYAGCPHCMTDEYLSDEE